MMFVKDTLIPSSMSGNLSLEEQSPKSFSGASDNESYVEIINTPLTEMLSPSSSSFSQTTSNSNLYSKPSKNPNIKKRRIDKDNTQKMIDLEEKKIAILQKAQENEKKNNENPDAQFLLSLLPYFNELEPLEKLELRNQIQNSVLNFFRKNKYSSNNNVSISEVPRGAVEPHLISVQIQTTPHQLVQKQIYKPYQDETNFYLFSQPKPSEQIHWNTPRNSDSTTVQYNMSNMNTTVDVNIPGENITLHTNKCNQQLFNVDQTQF